MDSPIGKVAFDALGRSWVLKYGHRAKVNVEKAFGTGFGAALQMVFPSVTPELAAQIAAAEKAKKPLSPELQAAKDAAAAEAKFEHIGTLLRAGLVPPPDDDALDDLIDTLGYARVIELINEAMTAASPPAQDGGEGESAGESIPPL